MISPVKVWRNQRKIQPILNKKGKILSWTRIITKTPYIVVLAELEDAHRLCGQLVDCDEKDVSIGKDVIVVLRKTQKTTEDGVIAYGVKFRLL